VPPFILFILLLLHLRTFDGPERGDVCLHFPVWQRVLDASGANKTQAARTLQIDYKTLLAKLKKYRLASD
jgi:DNA-binding protein Fis